MKDRSWYVQVIVLVIVAALAYLPLLHQIGYTNDDWYLMSSARTYGPGVFHPIYSVDRPLRAYVLEAEYKLFGENVLLYNLSAWVFRVLSALLFLWMLRLLWPDQPRWTFFMALLYLVYPGFLSQQNGIDYQAQLLSLFLAMFSLVLTVLAFFEGRLWPKVAEIIAAIVLGILYLGLVEYEAGYELIRLLLLFLLAGRVTPNYRARIWVTIKSWLPYLLITLGFGAWRFLVFKSERGATDANIQFENFRLYPIQTIYHWIVQVVQDVYDVLIAAWFVPLSQLKGFIQAWGVLIAVFAVVLVLLVVIKRTDDSKANSPSRSFPMEAVWFGLLSVIAGLIPIAMVNREVAFPAFSRYSLVSSIGVGIVIVAVLLYVKPQLLRLGVLAVLVFLAILTHHANGVKFVRETTVARNFWWQVSWRIPQLEPRTTLVARYPGTIQEDYFIWGPANLIYYPEDSISSGIGPTLYAAILDQNTVAKILSRERQEYDNRKNIVTYKNYRNVLVLSQPTAASCVHVIDGLQPAYSESEPDVIRTVGPYSEVEHIRANGAAHTPPEIVFGREPEHGWCYYYQKADLARQRGDWENILALGEEAFAKGLMPGDHIEWIPFLLAYAQAGDTQKLSAIAAQVTADPYIAQQVCQTLKAMPNLSDSVAEAIRAHYCTG